MIYLFNLLRAGISIYKDLFRCAILTDPQSTSHFGLVLEICAETGNQLESYIRFHAVDPTDQPVWVQRVKNDAHASW